MVGAHQRLWLKVGIFYLLALAISWSYWGMMIAQGLRVVPGSTASHLPGLMGPMLAAAVVIVAFDGRKALVDWLARFWRWPHRPALTGLLIAAPLAIATALLGWQALNGHPLPSVAALTAYPGLPAGTSTLAVLLIVLILNGFGEEAGWRGFLFEALAGPLGRFRAVLVTIPLWLFWHLPLFWINVSMQALLGPMLIGWMIGLALGAFVLAHVYVLTGRRLLAVVLWHVAYNFSVATAATSGLIAAVVTAAVMVWGLGVAIVWARAKPAADTH